jgi:hypothetical protein
MTWKAPQSGLCFGHRFAHPANSNLIENKKWLGLLPQHLSSAPIFNGNQGMAGGLNFKFI